MLAPRSVVFHKYEFSRNPEKFFFLERNRALVLLKNLRLRNLLVLAPALLAGELGLAAVALRDGWFRQKARAWGHLLTPRAWRHVRAGRAAQRSIRRVEDAEIVRLWSGRGGLRGVGRALARPLRQPRHAQGMARTPAPVAVEEASVTSLSVLVPVYNEQHLVAASLARLAVLEASPHLERVQVMVVDDSSRDGTPGVLAAFARGPRHRARRRRRRPPRADGTGAGPGRRAGPRAPRQDRLGLPPPRSATAARGRPSGPRSPRADGEYLGDPRRRPRVPPARPPPHRRRSSCEERADAVFGSRFAGGESRRVLLFRHELGNRLLTFLTNLVTNVNLTDMETCYKAVRTDLLRSIPIVSNDFRLEPELTIKLAKREARDLRGAHQLLGAHLPGGEEDRLARRRPGARRHPALLVRSDHIYVRDEHGSQMPRPAGRAPSASTPGWPT